MDFLLPPVGEGLLEVEMVRRLVNPGDAVARGQPLMEVLSDKASMEVPSPFAGTIREFLAEPGEKIRVGQVVLTYDGTESEPLPPPTLPVPNGESVKHAPPETGNESPPVSSTRGTAVPVAAAPSVRHLARKMNIDLSRITGTGPAGRVLLEDLTRFLAPKAKQTENEATPTPGTDTSFFKRGVPGTRMKMLGLRRKIAEHMVASKQIIPHYSYIDECDISDLVRLRGQLKETLAKAGVRLTFLPFFVKAVVRALKEFPIVNSSYDEAADEIVLHDRYNIGIAVATPDGLIVPVVKDADQREIANIATEIDRLSQDAKAGRPQLDDLKGGTFTITSIGGIGGLISTPIINHPEVGILGIGQVVRRPVYDTHGALHPADLVYLSFSFDHRVFDGAMGAAFGNAVIRHLRHPATLLLPERFSS